MVTFKTIKYKHYKKARVMKDEIAAGVINEDELTKFLMSLVEDWDYTDPETGKKLPITEAGLDEMSLDNFKELNAEFNAEMNNRRGVPKVNAVQSSSGSTPSKTDAKRARNRQTG